MGPVEIKSLRKKAGLTQQAFARLLGLSFVSINKWENAGSVPTGLSAVLLELLQNVLSGLPAHRVIVELERCKGKPLEVIRTLTRLERAYA